MRSYAPVRDQNLTRGGRGTRLTALYSPWLKLADEGIAEAEKNACEGVAPVQPDASKTGQPVAAGTSRMMTCARNLALPSHVVSTVT